MLKEISSSIIVMALTLCSCGAEVTKDSKEIVNHNISLETYGIKASIEIEGPEIEVFDIEDKYEHKLLSNKRIEITTKENLILVLNESQENGVEMKVDFAEGFGEVVVMKGENFCIIEQEDDEGNKVYDVSVFYKKGDSFLEIKVCDPESKGQVVSLDIAKKGLKMAKTFKFS